MGIWNTGIRSSPITSTARDIVDTNPGNQVVLGIQMDVAEKLVATLTVEWGHLATKEIVDLQERFGATTYTDPKAFATVYNDLLNKAISAELAYRKEKRQTVDATASNAYSTLKNDKSGIGVELKLNADNQAAYDKYVPPSPIH